MTKEDRNVLSALSLLCKRMDARMERIEKSLSPNTLRKAALYDEIRELPSLLGMRVESVVPSLSENGEFSVKVKYAIQEQVIRIPDVGESEWPDAVTAINRLDMISSEDCEKISKMVEKYSKRQKVD